MEFHRLGYPLLLLGVFALSWAARASTRARQLVLLAASYFFYAWVDVRYLAVLAGVTAVAYFGAPALARRGDGTRGRGGVLAAILALALAPLALLKYWDFAAQAFSDLLQSTTATPLLQIATVAGVSFYTFQAVGYLVDVYRGEVEPERDPLVLALFIGFFPQILAGPIGRSSALIPQWRNLPAYDDRLVADGTFLILSGAIKKILIGDFLGSRLVNPAFTYPTGIGWVGTLLGIYGFAFQLYGDFAGYSEMAIGSARCLGVRLAPNFDGPYRSRNLSEFWQRWHISLSTWIRDYTFLPLAGRAPSPARTRMAAVVSMTLCGLWHGASFAWIGWGALHGVGLAVHQSFLGAMRKRFALKKKLDQSKVARFAAGLVTFHFCCLGLWLVRGGDPSMQGVTTAGEAWGRFAQMARELVSAPKPEGLFFVTPLTVAALVLAAASHFFPGSWKLRLAQSWAAAPRVVQGAVLAACALALYVLRPTASPFIYTNF